MNGHICGGRYKLSSEQQMEATRLVQVERKCQEFVASKYKVGRSTVSPIMTEFRLKWLKQDLKGGVL